MSNAITFIEGFDHVSGASSLNAKGWTWSVTPDLTSGRILGHAINFSASSPGGAVWSGSRALAASTSNFVVGFAFDTSAYYVAGNGDGYVSIMQMRNGSTVVAALGLNSTGHLVVLSGGTIVATSPTVLNTTTWYYIELKVHINGASGTYELHLNGATDIASATANFGSSAVTNINLAMGQNSFTNTNGTFTYDDIYVLDIGAGEAAPWNDFLGDVAVETIYPTGDGAHAQWTPDSGTAHWSRVNDAGPDGDSSYVHDTTVGDRDSYMFGDLSILSGAVYAVQTVMYARKDNSGTKQICAVARPGVTDRDGATATLGTSYAYYTEIREKNPDTSAQWALSEVNATEFGIKVVT